MSILETDLTKCTGEKDGIFLFETFVMKGDVENSIENLNLNKIHKMSVFYEDEDIINLTKDMGENNILNKFKKHNISLSIYEKPDDEKHTPYTVITIIYRLSIEEVESNFNEVFNGDLCPGIVNDLIDLSPSLYFNISVIGIRNINKKDKMNLDNLGNLLCFKDSSDSNNIYPNNNWRKVSKKLH